VTALPIDPYVPAVLAAVREHRALVLSASPGAGKTTRVPPALAADGAVIVLQPRRVAARAMARRIADEQGWTLGREVGWHVRFERRFTADTRVLLATEGILTARLQHDPLLGEFRTIVIDEFHERSIFADVGLALAKQAWTARADLRIVVMSATIDAGPVRAFLGGCPHLDIPGRLHPVAVGYLPGATVADAVAEQIGSTDGNVLCFLPGAGEIGRALGDVRAMVGRDVDVLPLHGSLTADEQDRAIAPAAGRRVILATNIAETSLTVPDVTGVVDTGLHKVARYDEDRAIDSLQLERITADSAAQRAGRAGRLAPGRVLRLWEETDRLRPHGEAEIHRVDLSDAVLDVLAWGGDPLTFDWFDPPPPERIAAALALLGSLGAVRDGRVTRLGTRMKQQPLHPRLARMLIEANGARPVALACALLSERRARPPHPPATTSDLLTAIDDERALPPHVREVASRLANGTKGTKERERIDEEGFRRAILAGYPDRAARRRAAGSARFLLASGHGAVLGRESGVHDADFIVAIDVQAGKRGENAEATIRMASAIDRAWLATTRHIAHEFDAAVGRVRAIEREMYGAIVVAERPAAIDHDAGSRLLAEAYRERGWSEHDTQLLRRLRFAELDVDAGELLAAAAAGRVSLADVDLREGLDTIAGSAGPLSRDLDRLAPETLPVPSGRTARLRYEEDGGVVAAVKLQELFGLADSPRLGPSRRPVTFELLAPNGRPVQTTKDLRSFWNTTYQLVRKELRGRYPRHPWPEDPWTAPATARAKPRR
jgi:ATP-dependent helicase HrpB